MVRAKDPRVVPVSEFKARCSELVERVAAGEGDLVITRRGIPLARLVSADRRRTSPRGSWKGLVEIRGDIVHSDWSDEFEALRE
jgi:prevent-host-death family protein